jgi:ubiquinone/menaquinone biosynthesis C-methylase UbiE/uncharacterized protein YbaR (Trm112 family)
MMLQNLKNKAGEVKFRAKLFQQQVEGAATLNGELTSTEMLNEMRRRMVITRRDFAEIAQSGVLQSPFLELGAERGQRSLVLANDFGLDGYAADLSFESLRYADFLAQQEKLSKMPQRVCCDAYKLPFADDSIGFAFCYQTLHHFPDPTPIFRELYRVLRPGAVLHVDEEPIRRTWKLNLWKRRVFPKGRENKYVRYAKDYLLDFISEPHVSEVDYGICENDDISLTEWEKAIGQVENKKIRLKLLPIPRAMSRVSHDSERWGLRSSMCQALGGILQATITAKPARQESAMPREPLCCPICRGPLGTSLNSLFCERCSASYPTCDGILMLLPQEELQSLYPDAV